MSNLKMSAEQVRSIAKLVKLELSNEEVEKFRTTIPQTLDAVDILKELDTSLVLPTSQVTGLHNVFSGDNSESTLSQKLALSNAREEVKGLFATEAVFDRS